MAGPASKPRESLLGLVLSNDQLISLRAYEDARAANTLAGKSSAVDERQKFPTVPSFKPRGGTSGVGAAHSTVAPARTSARGLKGTRIRLTSVPPQSGTDLLCQARTTFGQSPHNNKSAGEESVHYEEEDEITRASKVVKKIDKLAVACPVFAVRRHGSIVG